MSRGPGAAQRFVLEQLHKPTPADQWPPWISIEALAARYAGRRDVGELVMVCDTDDWWRLPRRAMTKTPLAYDHLIGLSVESTQRAACSQHLPRPVVESIRRACKRLADQNLIEIRHIDVSDRGGAKRIIRDDFSWISRGVVAMLAVRRLLTEAERESEAPRVAERTQRLRAAVAMLRGGL